MGVLADLLSQWKGDLEREIARWDADPFQVAIQGEPAPRSAWMVTLEETGMEFGDSTSKQTAIAFKFEIFFCCPADRMERFLFHSSPDEDGMMRAIWNLRADGRLPTAIGDSDVELGEWSFAEDDSPLPVASRTITLSLEINFPDSRSHPIAAG